MMELMQTLANAYPDTPTADAVYLVVGIWTFYAVGIALECVGKALVRPKPVTLRGATPFDHGK